MKGITRLTNCRLVVGDKLEWRDLWLSSATGKIVDAQEAFFAAGSTPAIVHDLGGRIVSPGLIDVQINGAFGFDFSTPSPKYAQELQQMNKKLATTGVTSYLPTLPSQTKDIYHQTLHHLSRLETRASSDGAESLGAHCEGPFINPSKHGIHRKEVLLPPSSISALLDCYGHSNLQLDPATGNPRIKCITIAPELASSSVIPELRSRGVVVSVGHSAATYAQMQSAVAQGATMITHMYNAMTQPHHRDTGIFGILGRDDGAQRPYFGIIADGVHVHPSMVRLAYNAHPEGCILVTDAMAMLGMDDGEYGNFPWTRGATVVKEGIRLVLKGIPGSIAGGAATLLECVNNFIQWSEVSVPQALAAATSTPAKMLGLESTKGCLKVGADADLVVFDERRDHAGRMQLDVAQVWKFGEMILEAEMKQVMARL